MQGSTVSFQSGTNRSSWMMIVIATLGLAMVDIWGDMKGSSAALVPFNALVQDALTNGRMVGLTGIFTCCAIAAVRPGLFSRFNAVLRIVVPSSACLLSIIFWLGPSLGEAATPLCIGAALLSGLCYGWFEIKFLSALALMRRSEFSLVMTLAASLGIKMLALPLMGVLPPVGQGIVFAALPVMIGITSRILDGPQLPIRLFADGRQLPVNAPVVAVLLLLSMLSAAARGISGLGFWGGDNIIATGGLGPAAIATPLFLLCVYAAFAHRQEESFVSVIIKLLLLLLVGFLLIGGNPTSFDAIPEYLGDALYLFLDVFAMFLVRATAITTIRTTTINPYTAIGLARGTTCLFAIAFGLFALHFPGTQLLIVLFATFGAAVVALLMLERTTNRSSQVKQEDDLGSTLQLLADAHQLTARETEVFVLLAQGRSQNFISQQLVLAPSTVKTHIKHVYQKLNVQNKQDLISLVLKQSDDRRL